MIKAIYLISKARPAGPTNQALNILKGMKQNGVVDMRLVTLMPEQDGNSWLNRFLECGLTVVQLNPKRFSLYKSISALNQYIKENGIDVVHSTGYQADLVNMLLTHIVSVYYPHLLKICKFPLFSRGIAPFFGCVR